MAAQVELEASAEVEVEVELPRTKRALLSFRTLLASADDSVAMLDWFRQAGTGGFFARTVDTGGETALFAACEAGQVSLLEILTAAHCAAEDVRKPNGRGTTPMMVACQRGHLAVCQWLFEHGAAEDVRTADHEGRTPMLVACQHGHLHVCKWLLEHGAAEDLTTFSRDGWTPMSVSCLPHRIAVSKWLVLVGGASVSMPAQMQPSKSAAASCRALVDWAEARIAFHECFVKVVLFGMMHKRSGSHLLWMMGGGGASIQPRMLVAQFLDVPVKRELGNLRGALPGMRESYHSIVMSMIKT